MHTPLIGDNRAFQIDLRCMGIQPYIWYSECSHWVLSRKSQQPGPGRLLPGIGMRLLCVRTPLDRLTSRACLDGPQTTRPESVTVKKGDTSPVAVKQYESKSLHRVLSNLAPFGARRFPWSSKSIFLQEFSKYTLILWNRFSEINRA